MACSKSKLPVDDSRAYFGEPAANIVPSNADDVATPKCPATQVIACAVLEEFAIAVAEVVYEVFLLFRELAVRARRTRMAMAFCVSTD